MFPVCTIDPIDPIDPVDPIDPIDPINPIDPIKSDYMLCSEKLKLVFARGCSILWHFIYLLLILI